MKWYIHLIGLLLLNVAAKAQPQTEKVLQQGTAGVVEEFSVLKADHTVRQGPYIRYRPLGGRTGVAVFEAGNYENGLKEGEWRCFSEDYPWNKLLSKGSYHAGLPDGLWQYYHCAWTKRRGLEEAAPNGRKTKAGYVVSVVDTSAVLQAKGMNYAGMKAGVWVYYDAQNNIIQKINESTRQLLYWHQGTQEPVVGQALAENHPLLYVGGKYQLRDAIHHHIEAFALLKHYQIGSANFVFSVDSTGQQTHLGLGVNILPNAFEEFILSGLRNLKTTWLPQVVAGQPVAAEYRVRISIQEKNENGRMTVDMLGD
ncbi:toxin-antitoxin system YwqK family antitoxin [Hymenobacter negativus]|uniref:Uncharacterized protein n=1 Tax=Hymenobacter negativus TaxID=2795026 RepID=A0ABS3QM02_9BACT|nr:hypothetical protein [Hymenobacter negativus]MBO2011710.1 hypothetical protein [Hymenobacter negativus]